jgi:hypothetical protein
VRMSIEASFTELLVPSINGRSSGSRLAGTGSVDRRNKKFRKTVGNNGIDSSINGMKSVYKRPVEHGTFLILTEQFPLFEAPLRNRLLNI